MKQERIKKKTEECYVQINGEMLRHIYLYK